LQLFVYTIVAREWPSP